MKFEHILYEPQGGVVTITLNRPEVLNAMQPQTCRELADALLDYVGTDDLRVAILKGAGTRAFSVGADLKYRAEENDAEDAEGRPVVQYPSDVLTAVFARCNKPVIAAIRGYAIGGGFELALRCDLIVASETARFGLPEVKRGLVADTGGLYFLPRRIPYIQAMGWILTGDFFEASEAFRWGLVNEVVPDEQLESAASAWAERILECSPLAIQAAKDIVRAFSPLATEPDLAAVDRLAAVKQLRESEDYREGPRAFAEKRKPSWKGR